MQDNFRKINKEGEKSIEKNRFYSNCNVTNITNMLQTMFQNLSCFE